MAAGRHIKALITAYRDRDDLAFRRAAQAIIDEEESKRHTALARDLKRLLAAPAASSSAVPAASDSVVSLPEPPRDRDSGMPLATVQIPRDSLQHLVLETELANSLLALVDEVERWSLLDRHGVPRRNRLLLHGPPGCGKTSIAVALAHALGRPLVTVRVESVVSSFLGETSSNVKKVFDFAASGAFLVFFDEFDSLGKGRDDPTDHGELRRVVNAFLQLIDGYTGPSLIVAATNHAQILDEAMWRRFDEVLNVGAPDQTQTEAVLRQTLADQVPDTAVLRQAAKELRGLPHAAARHVADGARRRAVLRGATVRSADIEASVQDALRRPWI